jgi:hypothetical protein
MIGKVDLHAGRTVQRIPLAVYFLRFVDTFCR